MLFVPNENGIGQLNCLEAVHFIPPKEANLNEDVKQFAYIC